MFCCRFGHCRDSFFLIVYIYFFFTGGIIHWIEFSFFDSFARDPNMGKLVGLFLWGLNCIALFFLFLIMFFAQGVVSYETLSRNPEIRIRLRPLALFLAPVATAIMCYIFSNYSGDYKMRGGFFFMLDLDRVSAWLFWIFGGFCSFMGGNGLDDNQK